MQTYSDALFTDLYQLTMAQAYFQAGQVGEAAFSLFFRGFPANRAYFVFCGLAGAVEYAERFGFSEDDVSALDAMGVFDADFLDCLRGLQFTGEIRAMREGEVFFPNEPVLEVSGPIIECQLLETWLLNHVGVESTLATKAARVVDAAGERDVFDFGARRAHGRGAAMSMARASYAVGFGGTSNVEAARRFGIPAVGTMAHSFIASFGDELEAFRSYARSFPDSSVFLVDTYDTVGGVRNAIAVAREMRAAGQDLRAVRLDSGDLGALAVQARRMLDEAGFPDVRIVASGGLDEYSIDALVRRAAPIDVFGVGTRVITSADAPYADFVYKLVEYEGKPMMKLSEGKASAPMRKQVFREWDADGIMARDTIAEMGAEPPSQRSERLLYTVVENGRAARALPDLDEVREFHAERMARLPQNLRGVRPSGAYEVEISTALCERTERAARELGRGSQGKI